MTERTLPACLSHECAERGIVGVHTQKYPRTQSETTIVWHRRPHTSDMRTYEYYCARHAIPYLGSLVDLFAHELKGWETER